jgi:hypothetical protein
VLRHSGYRVTVSMDYGVREMEIDLTSPLDE